ncbi:MAG: ABC-F family ATP-binding cassette domain-containing protein [Deltaproteobacteria bacterium]|nr:ABC-F family ATP-binding cassette domain-containing protein [Deltaproteobacteria bacterium]MBI3295300.1 ABC-F family ATP-binding cassette domain-containing protein [Deltaproteobacteria bacterium]
MKPTPLLEASELSYNTPEGRELFAQLNFGVNHGQILVVTGPNGSGKSTLLRLLLKDAPAKTGLVRCTVKRAKIGLLPQLQNIAFHLPLQLRDVIGLLTRAHPADAARFSLIQESDLGKAWNTASGGERQRTLLTCLLLNSPELLILDEPFNHLDPSSQAIMLEALSTFLKGGSPRAVVLVSHKEIPSSGELQGKVVTVKLMGERT